jgi:hypothetical protein
MSCNMMLPNGKKSTIATEMVTPCAMCAAVHKDSVP